VKKQGNWKQQYALDTALAIILIILASCFMF
jgi:hypothetical protein